MEQATAVTVRTALYKGKAYILRYLGNTKYGVRANLGFWGPSGTNFWAPAHMVQETAPVQINAQGWKIAAPAAPQQAYKPVQQQQPPAQEGYQNFDDDFVF